MTNTKIAVLLRVLADSDEEFQALNSDFRRAQVKGMAMLFLMAAVIVLGSSKLFAVVCRKFALAAGRFAPMYRLVRKRAYRRAQRRDYIAYRQLEWDTKIDCADLAAMLALQISDAQALSAQLSAVPAGSVEVARAKLQVATFLSAAQEQLTELQVHLCTVEAAYAMRQAATCLKYADVPLLG